MYIYICSGITAKFSVRNTILLDRPVSSLAKLEIGCHGRERAQSCDSMRDLYSYYTIVALSVAHADRQCPHLCITSTLFRANGV